MQNLNQTKEQSSLQFMTHRVITMLDRKQIEFLDKLGKDALFSTGRKLSYSEALRWLIELAMEIGLSGEKIDSVKAFKEKFLLKCKEYLSAKEKQA